MWQKSYRKFMYSQINDTKHTKTFISRPFGNSLDLRLVLVYLLGIMHQSFVTTSTAPTGLGNSRDIVFPLCKARVYVQQSGDISTVKALLKSRQVILKLGRPVWAWNQKPRCSTLLWERCWGQNMALKPCYVPVIQGPMGAGVTNVWWISLLRLAAVVKLK